MLCAAYVAMPLPQRPDPCTCRAGCPLCPSCLQWAEARHGQVRRGTRIVSLTDLQARIADAEADLRDARAGGQRERAKNVCNQLCRYRRRLKMMDESHRPERRSPQQGAS